MKRTFSFLALAVGLGSMASFASAGTVTNITLHPGDFGSTNVVGNGSPAPGFSNSSWQANTNALTLPMDNKSELYIPVASLFSGSVSISDIASISYWTNKPGNAGDPDWTVLLYTNTTGSGDEATWYHSRLNSEPYLTGTTNANDPANTWHQWSSNDPTNPMRFFDAGRDGGVQGTYTDPTLAQITSGAVTWNGAGENGSSYDYTSDTIKFFSLQTGSGWANGFTGLVDGLSITLNNGDVGNVNLEAVPLPKAAYAGLGLIAGLGLLGAAKRRRRLAV